MFKRAKTAACVHRISVSSYYGFVDRNGKTGEKKMTLNGCDSLDQHVHGEICIYYIKHEDRAKVTSVMFSTLDGVHLSLCVRAL